MSRLDELDIAPYKAGQRAAIVAIAEWWFARLGPKARDKYAFREFLREKFGFRSKQCNTCGKWKPDYDFPLAKACKDGRLDFCRRCDAAKQAEYRLRNLERERAKQRERYYANRERFAVYRRLRRKREIARTSTSVGK